MTEKERKIQTFRVTVNTSTVKTIVPKVQFPKTWKTCYIAAGVSVLFLEEAHRDNEEERGASRDRRGGMGWSDCYGGHYATLCHAVPHRRVTQSWDGDRYNLLLTAMSIKDTSHWTTCISWFLGNLTQFLLSHNTSAHHRVLVPFAECTNGCFSIWFGLQILVTTHDKEKQILYINPNDGDEWEGCLPKAVKIWMHTLKQKVKCKSFQKMQKKLKSIGAKKESNIHGYYEQLLVAVFTGISIYKTT